MENALLVRAIKEAGIDAPIYAIEEMEGGNIVFHLPHRNVTWKPGVAPAKPDKAAVDDSPQVTTADPSSATGDPSSATGDDFTAIPYVGKEISQALNNAGFFTFRDLVNAPDPALLDLPQIGPFALGKIREYLQKHYL